MSITVTGKIERKDIGTGAWALVTKGGEIYELKNAPPELCQSQAEAKVEGKVQDDLMTIAAIGPVLEVISFELL